MANPFLFTEEPAAPTGSAAMNPFLSGNVFGDDSVPDNPFMSTFSQQSAADTGYESSTSATNPFAFGATTEEDSNFFSSSADSNATFNYENIFSSAPAPSGVDLFGSSNVPSEVHQTKPSDFGGEDLLVTNLPDNSTFLDSDTHGGFMDDGEGDKGPPRRPPPPRPGPPKETKDLILSVTGAMEATSSHLLDRLQATRTPSPTPMRDLHSPSPTQFGDLLEVDGPPAPPPTALPQEGNLLGDDFDFSAPIVEPSIIEKKLSLTAETIVAPIAPMPSVPPETQPVAPVPTKVPPAMPPARPAPPAVPVRPKVPPQPPRPPPVTVPVRPPTPPEKHPEPPPDDDTGFDDVFGSPMPNEPNQSVPSDPVTNEAFDMNFMTPQPASQHDSTVFSSDISDDVFIAPATAESNAFGEPEPLPEPTSFTEPVAPIQKVAEPENDFGLDFSMANAAPPPVEPVPIAFPPPAASQPDDFDAFAAKFDSVGFPDVQSGASDAFGSSDPFGGSSTKGVAPATDPFDPFASSFGGGASDDASTGFGAEDNFDSFLSLREPPPVPQGTPARISRAESAESNEGNEFNIFIKPKAAGDLSMADNGPLPTLAPPPKSPSQMNAFQDTSPRFNPFDNSQESANAATENIFAQAMSAAEDRALTRTESQETPPTPLFDEDVSQPLEDFPRIHYTGQGWEMQLRQPNKKKITGQRFWKKIWIKLVYQGENPVLQLFNGKDDKDPFQELPLQPCYSVSEIGAQQYDQYGKIFTVKLQFIFYKERPGVRPGQVTKAERITNKLSQFAAYAIQGDYQGVKEFGSDLKKLGLPVEHAPQISQLFKIGSQCYEDMKQFSMCIEEALFRLSAHRDRALNYKMEEVQITTVDELYVEQTSNGAVEKQIARVRLFFLGFLSGMPDIELGVNDLVRQGKEVVGRHDIIPVVTEEWIRLEAVEFHTCVQQDEYERTRTIKFKPPDAMYIELMRFRVRPPRNRELPLQVKCTICVTGNKVEIHGDILVPGFTSRKLGQIPCEDVMVRIPIPECWIYQFRVEKHFRYGSVKSAHRRTGKVKGIERFLGAIENMEPSLMEVTSGQAKYEHQHRSIVWRMPRLPKEGQGAYTTHNLVVRLQLTSYDQIPDELAKYCYVEFTMPATTVSHTTVRSVSIGNSDSDTPPEKYVRHLSRHEYRVEIEHTQGEGPAAYIAATVTKPPVISEEPKPAPPPPESDSDSSG